MTAGYQAIQEKSSTGFSGDAIVYQEGDRYYQTDKGGGSLNSRPRVEITRSQFEGVEEYRARSGTIAGTGVCLLFAGFGWFLVRYWNSPWRYGLFSPGGGYVIPRRR
jgi:hypothetical protein